MILFVSGPTFKAYCENPSVVLDVDRKCPQCGIRLFTRHDTYMRWVYFPSGSGTQIRIFRLRCRPCHIVASLLPDFLIPYRRYLGDTVAEAVEMYASTKASYRGLAIERSGAVLPEDTSTTDALLSLEIFPSYQSIFGWMKRIGDLAEAYSSGFLAWSVRLKPDQEAFHELATDTELARSKGRSDVKRGQLANAAILVGVLRHFAAEQRTRRSWWQILGSFVAEIMGQVPWRGPPQPQSS